MERVTKLCDEGEPACILCFIRPNADLEQTVNKEFLARIGIKISSDDSTMLSRGFQHLADSPTGQFLEPYFAALGKEVRIRATVAKASWIELANGDNSMSRTFAISLGYTLAALVLAIYLNVLTVGSVQSAGRAIRNAIRQQLVVLKVSVQATLTFKQLSTPQVVAVIMIELVFFPLGCGVMLDLFTLELFPGTTLASRIAFFRYAPMTSVFYHWMIGTMFMYQFAILLGKPNRCYSPFM